MTDMRHMSEHKHAERKAKAHEPEAQSQTAPPSPARNSLAVAPVVSFADVPVGDFQMQDVPVFNLDQAEAEMSAIVIGSSAFVIVSSPTKLRPSSAGFDPASAIKLAFKPTADQQEQAELHLIVAWPGNRRETRVIHISAAGHMRDAPTHEARQQQLDEQKVEQQSREKKETENARDEKKIAAIAAKGVSYDVRITDAAQKLQIAARAMFQKQQHGAEAAGKKAAAFRRKAVVPKEEESVEVEVMKELAWFALELATDGIAARVQAGLLHRLHGLEGGFKDDFTHTGKPLDSNGVISGVFEQRRTKSLVVGEFRSETFAELVGLTLEKGGPAIESQLKRSKPSGETDVVQSASAAADVASRVDFFRAQSDALSDSEGARLTQLVDVQRGLLPLNNKEHAARAAQILDATAAEFTSASESAGHLQEIESTKAWARFVSHSSLGTVSKEQASADHMTATRDGSSTARITNAATGAGEFDGLVDLELTGDVHSPSASVQLVSAKLTGISRSSAELLELSQNPLQSSGLPVRARIRNDVLDVTVIRDEAGNVRFSDESGTPGMPTNWLARRGGGTAGDSGGAQRGAQRLIQDVTTKSLSQLGVDLELDDA